MAARSKTETADASVPHPRTTRDLLGHAEGEHVLLRAWSSGRLPHAWLITGARGIGKATLAYRFGKFVLAGGGQGGGLFGGGPESLDLGAEHPVARQVAAGSHPDIFSLEPFMPREQRSLKPSADILVEHVRQAVHFCFMTPSSSDWRVIVVDAAEEMNPNAANALLKVLEEPPSQAVLLLVSHAPARLLPTIRSRCAQLSLSTLDADSMATLLDRHLPDVGEDDRAALAQLAEGSIGRALDLHKAGGVALYRELVDLLTGLPQLETSRLHAFADKLAQGQDPTAFRLGGDLLAWWLGRLIRAKARGETPADVVAGEGAATARLAARGDLEQWLSLWEKIAGLFRRAERANLDRKQVVLTAFLDLQSTAS
ncbi:DNA polymerase III subunit delta' [Rhodovibrio salinarum]|uniref:DNA polymerase III subunit delta n=1 Tax=Rhodovibrio salinarum TaxID=1087 RepID=A0A934QJE7_9PROT|nr:DNA polymerase III subunit delta' [Rhodovibrio salinarum]MBK1697989.1 DNA polymerase III subunit delta' [Rhodovibrio salinarum]